MRVAIVGQGVRGAGHVGLAQALCLGFAQEVEIDIYLSPSLFNSDFVKRHQADKFQLIELEDPQVLAGWANSGQLNQSVLFAALSSQPYDVVIGIQFWFNLQILSPALHKLGTRLYLVAYHADRRLYNAGALHDPQSGFSLSFDQSLFDACFAIEPFDYPDGFILVPPLTSVREHLLLGKQSARAKLLSMAGREDNGKPLALIASNGVPGEFARLLQDYQYLENENYLLVGACNIAQEIPARLKHISVLNIFPLWPYFRGFDLFIGAAGYGMYWEVRKSGIQAIFVPMPRNWEDQSYRLEHGSKCPTEGQGAQQIVEHITRHTLLAN